MDLDLNTRTVILQFGLHQIRLDEHSSPPKQDFNAAMLSGCDPYKTTSLGFLKIETHVSVISVAIIYFGKQIVSLYKSPTPQVFPRKENESSTSVPILKKRKKKPSPL